ncbi:MAG: hypothetical protein ACUVX9_17620 [Anaerolineae bacterium]
MVWHLDRPHKPALPSSFFWTWDHSTNHVLDEEGLQNSGCYNVYLKGAETYVEDYRRLTDLAADLGVKGVIIWGFLRDSHGGVEASKRVAGYAASKGVAIMPGVGTTWYGGCYYEGDHPYNIERFLREHPEARILRRDGSVYEFAGRYGISPRHPAFLQWLQEGIRWLFREFEIGGANLENGDFMEDYHPLTLEFARTWPADDIPFFRFQAMSYIPAVEAVADLLDAKLVTYATYTGFVPGEITREGEEDPNCTHCMGLKPPAMLDRIHPQALCQWTLSGMLHEHPLPLTVFLNDGAPAEALENPKWPAGVVRPGKRAVGFVHQGSQWYGYGPQPNGTRYVQVISAIKEACLRAYRAGLEGVGIHGEVSPRFVPAALNYLAFSHFLHWPEDSLRGFARGTLAQVLGSEAEAEEYVEVLAHLDAGSLSEEHRVLALRRHVERERALGTHGRAAIQPWRFWQWLDYLCRGYTERQTVSII